MEIRITEEKYKKLRRNTLIICAISIVIYVLLIRYTMKVNPEAFIYNPVTDPEPPFAKLQTMLWWIVGIGWVVFLIIFGIEVKKNPNHWARRFTKKLEELNDDEKDNMGRS